MKRFNVTVNGVAYDVVVEEVAADAAAPASAPAAPKTAPAAPKAAPKASGAAGSVVIKAPLQGTVMKINVKPGDTVKKGTPVAVIEALKMENEVMAPQDGTVVSVEVRSGDSVKTDAVLITMN